MPIGLIGITLLSMIAASAHEDTPRQARAHVHGAGEAFILLEGNELFIQIAAPAANFRTPEGRLLSVADLSSSDMTEDFLSLPSRAQCTFQSQQVEQEGYDGEDAGEHGHSHDASHAHDDGHHTEGGHDHEQHGDGDHGDQPEALADRNIAQQIHEYGSWRCLSYRSCLVVARTMLGLLQVVAPCW